MNIQAHKQAPQRGGQTVIAANLIKESVMLDRFGNEIDPRTKQIIRPVDKKEE